MSGTLLHLAPHPDDELLGAPATLMAMRDHGYRVVNLACTLGRPQQRAAREVELRDACRLAAFELRLPAGEAGGDDGLPELLANAIAELRPEIVVSPSPHDCHPAHELVARAARESIREAGASPPRWWMWGLWGGLPLPTLGTAFDDARLEEIHIALEAHRGELRRNDYRRLVTGRSMMYGSLGPELLFGFGTAAEPAAPNVELLTEVTWTAGRWLLGRPRWLDPAAPLADPGQIEVGDWLEAASFAARRQRPGS